MSLTSYRAAPPRVNVVAPWRTGAGTYSRFERDVKGLYGRSAENPWPQYREGRGLLHPSKVFAKVAPAGAKGEAADAGLINLPGPGQQAERSIFLASVTTIPFTCNRFRR